MGWDIAKLVHFQTQKLLPENFTRHCRAVADGNRIRRQVKRNGVQAMTSRFRPAHNPPQREKIQRSARAMSLLTKSVAGAQAIAVRTP